MPVARSLQLLLTVRYAFCIVCVAGRVPKQTELRQIKRGKSCSVPSAGITHRDYLIGGIHAPQQIYFVERTLLLARFLDAVFGQPPRPQICEHFTLLLHLLVNRALPRLSA